MLKWLFWLSILLVFWGISRSRSRLPGRPSKSAADRSKGGLACCAYCQLHVPDDEAVRGDGESFCCEQHRRLWKSQAR